LAGLPKVRKLRAELFKTFGRSSFTRHLHFRVKNRSTTGREFSASVYRTASLLILKRRSAIS
jgi:hypothetical protein